MTVDIGAHQVLAHARFSLFHRGLGYALAVAGLAGPLPFSTRAMRRVHALSRGIPRRINALCDRLLLLAYLAERDAIEAQDVTEVVDDMAREAGMPAHGPLAGPPPAGGAASDGDPIRRLESGMLRIERANLQILSSLQKLLMSTARV